MKNYQVIEVGKRQHVVCEGSDRRNSYPNANYLKKGVALCGVLKNGESLNDFLKARQKKEIINKF
jgi:hypothetical protein